MVLNYVKVNKVIITTYFLLSKDGDKIIWNAEEWMKLPTKRTCDNVYLSVYKIKCEMRDWVFKISQDARDTH